MTLDPAQHLLMKEGGGLATQIISPTDSTDTRSLDHSTILVASKSDARMINHQLKNARTLHEPLVSLIHDCDLRGIVRHTSDPTMATRALIQVLAYHATPEISPCSIQVSARGRDDDL